MSSFKLTPDQIGDLREVGNIGAGNAASRLSDLIYRRCIIDIPQVSYMDAAGIKNILNMEESYIVALHIKIMGDIPAMMFVVMKRIHAQVVVSHMTKSTSGASGKNFDFTAQFALKQLGELLTKSFFESINQFLMTKAKYAMPEIIMQKWSTAVASILTRISGNEEEQLLIHSSFFDPEKTFEGKFIYVLSLDSQKRILEKIRVLVQ
jgi:chemotaxis protein CheC